MGYKPEEYWQNQLSDYFNLKGVGNDYFSLHYNKNLYKAKEDKLNEVLEDLDQDLSEAKILDMGVGTGFFIDYYSKKSDNIVGVDITEESVNNMRKKYPEHDFYKSDIGKKLDLEQKFDVINVFDVLYHIKDEEKYKKAVENIEKHLAQNGVAVVTESYRSDSSDHYKYRGNQLETLLRESNQLDLIKILPLYSFLNKPRFGIIPPLTFIDSIFSLVYRKLDQIIMIDYLTNMHIFVAQKRE